MRKIQLLALAGLAVFAFSAVAASSAVAKEWLLNGEPMAAAKPAAIEGELLLEDMKSSPAVIDVLCSGKFVGSVGPGAENLVELVEGLAGEDNTLDCVAHEICNAGLATVTAIHLPWKSTIELMTSGEALDILTGTGGEPGYTVECATILGTFTDTCVAEAGGAQALLTNVGAEVIGEFSENEAITPPGACTNGGAKQGLVVGSGKFVDLEGGTLAVS
jgi:hypothetical protein